MDLLFRVAFHPGSAGLSCEVLPAGVKWGVIWLAARECGATLASERSFAFLWDNQTLLFLVFLIRFQQIDDWCDARPVLQCLS